MLWSLIDVRRFFSFSSETSHYWLFICDTYILCLKYTDSLTQRTIAEKTSLQAVEMPLPKANFHSCLAHSSTNYILLTKNKSSVSLSSPRLHCQSFNFCLL